MESVFLNLLEWITSNYFGSIFVSMWIFYLNHMTEADATLSNQ